MTDFLDEKRKEINARLKELEPLVDEYARLEAAAAALAGRAPAADAPARALRAGPPRPAKQQPAGASATTRRRGRPKGRGTRATEALQLVAGNPGITIPEIAEKMGIKQNYLYRVLGNLAEDGLVAKQGRGWHSTAGG